MSMPRGPHSLFMASWWKGACVSCAALPLPPSPTIHDTIPTGHWSLSLSHSLSLSLLPKSLDPPPPPLPPSIAGGAEADARPKSREDQPTRRELLWGGGGLPRVLPRRPPLVCSARFHGIVSARRSCSRASSVRSGSGRAGSAYGGDLRRRLVVGERGAGAGGFAARARAPVARARGSVARPRAGEGKCGGGAWGIVTSVATSSALSCSSRSAATHPDPHVTVVDKRRCRQVKPYVQSYHPGRHLLV
ncbi:hypothetical protein GUJ93_ZPchr0012g21999 [Zizania palustris]|uniref:Uncharacterized protein n=1 Tax=Zizania palustris TaxID=103762 RepID=A0A8J6BVQ9_ZIZPA|nr:hypothetical protein GUJ93_ZPchr0012g21999 [Zizania palustris]